MKKVFIGLAIFILIVLSAIWYFRRDLADWWWQENQPGLPMTKIVEEKESTPPPIEEVIIPPEFNLAVPFTSQAPFARWDHFDEEMCEEASLLMVNRYWQKREIESPIDAENSLKEIQTWEEASLDVWESTTAEQVARTAKEMLGYQDTEVISLNNFDQIKKEVAQGQPVILPTAGRELKNPNFKQPGPIYHMLVVRGWLTDGRIITNDPGTRRGEGYLYDQEVLWQAIADWNGSTIDKERKVMVVVK